MSSLFPPLIAPSSSSPPPPPPPPPSLSEPEPLIKPLISKLWQTLDVRAMILLSLLLQIALFVLGKSRKHRVSVINKMILWFAYISKDWVSIAALGKLSNPMLSNSKIIKYSNPQNSDILGVIVAADSYSNLLTSLWTPLLILHLGGPDTITAFSFHDTQLWNRHLLILLVQCFLAFCVIIWSMPDVLSFTLVVKMLLYFVGISKYIERILCLKVTNSMKAKQTISVFKNPGLPPHPLLENQESKSVLLGYALFTAMRPDVNDYLCHKEYPTSFKVRMQTYLRKTNHEVKSILKRWLGGDELRSSHLTHFDIAVVELGFIFDVVYTKAAFIYTRKGCILRLISFTLSTGILVFFLVSFKDLLIETMATIDVCLTMTLLVGTFALDLCALLSILCSDWAVILMHNNCLGRKISRFVLHYFPCFLRRQKRRSAWMGQFDLLDYGQNSRKDCCGDILENYNRFKHTKFEEVPSCLKSKEVYKSRLDSFFVSSDSFEATRGGKTLVELEEGISDIHEDLERSIKVDFDASIIIWHLVTSIRYKKDSQQPNQASQQPNEAMTSSKYLSDYMMYLLVMRPAMLLPEDCRSFWLDHTLDELRNPCPKELNKDADTPFDTSELSSQTEMENLPKYAEYLAEELQRKTNRWELINAMWIEMLLYAAHSCPHVNHVKQLEQYGREFLTIIWIMGGHRIVEEA